MKKYPIMIVDDSEDDRYLLKRHLKKIDLVGKVFEERDGSSALEFLENYEANEESFADDFPPVILFLDVNMPKVGGFEFLKSFSLLREKLDFSSMSVLMFSTSQRDEDVKQAMSYSFVKDYLVKGDIDSKQLEQQMLEAIDKTSL